MSGLRSVPSAKIRFSAVFLLRRRCRLRLFAVYPELRTEGENSLKFHLLYSRLDPFTRLRQEIPPRLSDHPLERWMKTFVLHNLRTSVAEIPHMRHIVAHNNCIAETMEILTRPQGVHGGVATMNVSR